MSNVLFKSSEIAEPDGIELPCSNCGWPGGLAIGQQSLDGKLRWFESTLCQKCGKVLEADGVGFPPSAIRKLLVEKDGEWCVIIKDARSTSNVIKVLKSTLSLEMKAALALLRTDSGIVFKGTKSESLWLARLLEAAGESPLLSLQAEG